MHVSVCQRRLQAPYLLHNLRRSRCSAFYRIYRAEHVSSLLFHSKSFRSASRGHAQAHSRHGNPITFFAEKDEQGGETSWRLRSRLAPNVSAEPKDLVIVSNLWLRDHCQCDVCVHPVTKQRQLDTFAESLDTKIKHIKGFSAEADTAHQPFEITWGDGHRSIFQVDWLHRSFDESNDLQRRGIVKPSWWSSFDPSARQPHPSVDYTEVIHGPGMSELMQKLRKTGYCIVDETPIDPGATQSLLEMIGPIRNTHYGGFYDFTSDLASKDTAYTSLALKPHTDTTYFGEPAALQAFHMLSHKSGSGGATVLVDGYAAANALFQTDKIAYETLYSESGTVFAHSSGNKDVSIQGPGFRVFSSREVKDGVGMIKWNNDDRVAFQPGALQRGLVDEWYRAAAKYNSLLNDANADWHREFQLQPGRTLIFDNWRILHGRTAFTGERRMCGGYISRDDYISRYKVATRGHGDVLENGLY